MNTKTLIYVGPFDRVIVDRPDGSREFVDRDGTFVTTAAHAAALLEQPSNWRTQKHQAIKEEQGK